MFDKAVAVPGDRCSVILQKNVDHVITCLQKTILLEFSLSSDEAILFL